MLLFLLLLYCTCAKKLKRGEKLHTGGRFRAENIKMESVFSSAVIIRAWVGLCACTEACVKSLKREEIRVF